MIRRSPMPLRAATSAGWLAIAASLAIRPLSAQDCNGNSRDDEQEAQGGFDVDCNGNRVPDECDLLPDFEFGTSWNLAARRPVSIVAVDLDGDGDPDLVTANADSENLSTFINDGPAGFRPAIQIPLGSEPTAMASADLDADGDADLVVLSGPADVVSIFEGRGGGRLRRATDLACTGRPVAIAVLPSAGAGPPDFAVALRDATAVAIWKNEGGMAFTRVSDVAVEGSPVDLAAADLDADGILDLAVLVDDDRPIAAGDFVLVLRGEGNQTFLAGRTHALDGSAASIWAGDLDRDGRPDLALTGSGLREVVVLWNQPAGEFEAASLRVSESCRDGFAADVDGDSDLDLVVAGSGSRVAIIENLGGRQLSESARFGVWSPQASSFVGCDLEGDGDLDLAVVGEGMGTYTCIALFVRDVANGYSRSTVDLQDAPVRGASGDLDGDGLADIAIATEGHQVQILLSGRPPDARMDSVVSIGKAVADIAVADIDGDSVADLVVAHGEDSVLSVLLGVGNGELLDPVPVATGLPSCQAIAAGDLDLDGDQDLIVCVYSTVDERLWRGVVVLSQDGAGRFTEAWRGDVTFVPVAVAALDIEGDLDLDFVVDQDRLSAYRNLGQLRFEATAEARPEPCQLSSDTADIDGDGSPDLICQGGSRLFVVRTLRGGDLSQRAKALPAPSWAIPMALARDFDGDGRTDVAAMSSQWTIYFLSPGAPAVSRDADGNGVPDTCDLQIADCNHNGIRDGEEIESGAASDCDANLVPDECDLEPALALAPAVAFRIGTEPYSLVVADLDGDGDLDAASANLMTDDVSILVNDGNTGLLPERRVKVDGDPLDENAITRPSALVAGDLDGDGDLDLAVQSERYSMSSADTAVTILWNEAPGAFVADASFLVAPRQAQALVAADLDGDGRMDLVSVSDAPTSLSVFLGGPGGLGEASQRGLPSDIDPNFLVADDLDLDGDIDLVVGGSKAIALMNRGDATFEAGSTVDLVVDASGAYVPEDAGEEGVLTDLDGDGDPDLAVTRPTGGRTSVFLNEPGVTFRSEARELLAAGPSGICASDLDGDGDVDLVTTHLAAEGRIAVWLNDGGGAFDVPRTFEIPAPDPPPGSPPGEVLQAHPFPVRTGDVDGNGAADVLVGVLLDISREEDGDRYDRLDVLLNYSGKSRDCNENGIPDSCEIADGTLADSNGDGIADDCLLMLRFGPSVGLRAFRRGDADDDGSATIGDAIAVLGFLFLGSTPPSCLETADVDDDGRIDVSDPIAELRYLFLGGPHPAPPGPPPAPCGLDGSTSPDLGCEEYRSC